MGRTYHHISPLAFLFTLTFVMLTLVQPASAAELVGQVSDHEGAPIAGALVIATAGSHTTRASTTEGGTFRLELPEPVETPLQVTAVAPGRQAVTVDVNDPSRPVTLTLAPRSVFTGQVEVTAHRATAGISPIPFTDIAREEIERAHWGQDVPMFLSQVPGFYAYNDQGHGIGYSYFTLRGFDMRRTAVTINGVPLNAAHSHSVFFVDLADFLTTVGDIQVQRGVGTATTGTAAIGGSVDLRTRHPLPEQRLRLTLFGGSWGTRRTGFEYDSGITDSGWSFTFRYSDVTTDGYRDQSWVDMWNYYATAERQWDRSSLEIVLFGGPEETHLAFLGVPKAYLDGEITGDRREDRRYNPLTFEGEIDHFFQPHHQIHHTVELSDDLTVRNTLFYFTGDGYFDQMVMNGSFELYNLPPFPDATGEPVTSTDLVTRRGVDEWDGGWIPQVEWTHAGGLGRLRAGALVRLYSGQHTGEIRWAERYPPDIPPYRAFYDYHLAKQTFQPFIEETFTLNEQWTLTGGLTWTHHTYEFDRDQRKGLELESTYSWLLPRIGATFTPAPGWNLYGSVSRGAREPAWRDIYDAQDVYAEPQDLEHEDLIDWELGVRRRWATGFVKLGAYLLDFDNEIVFAGGISTDGLPLTANGAATTHRGIELEAGWTPIPRWSAHLAVSVSENEFDEFVEYGWDGEPIDHSGNAIAGVPDDLATLRLTGGWGPVDGVLSLRYVGDFYLDNTEDLRKSPEQRNDPEYIHRVNEEFTVIDLTLRCDLGRRTADLLSASNVALELRANNITDELYTTFGYVWGPEPEWIPAATRSAYAGLTIDW